MITIPHAWPLSISCYIHVAVTNKVVCTIPPNIRAVAHLGSEVNLCDNLHTDLTLTGKFILTKFCIVCGYVHADLMKCITCIHC